MLAILLGLVAACTAAPRINHHHYDPFADELFDTRQFWAEMANEMRQLDTMLTQFYQNFPSITSTQGVEGNEYKITIPLNGFAEKEIVVKAREGLLMVQAVHKMEEGERSYLDIKTLPAYVNTAGSWTYEQDVLKIVFPLKPEAVTEVDADDVTEPVTEAVTEHSQEHIDPLWKGSNGNVDADVGVRGDRDRELNTNEISKNTVEATTYAVDLKDEVEFVPVHYR